MVPAAIAWILIGLQDPQPGRKLSLRQAVQMALQNNTEIEVARFEPWIEGASLAGLHGAFDHVLYSSWQSGRTEMPGTTFLSGATDIKQTTHDLGLGVRRMFSNGLQAQLEFRSQGIQTNSTFALVNPTWQDSLGLTLNLPILRNAGVDANTTAIMVQQNRHQASVDNFEVALTNSVHGIEQAYFELAFAIESQRLAQRSLDLARRLVDETRRRLVQKMVAPVHVTEAQVQVAQKEQALIRAEQLRKNANDRVLRLVDPQSLRRGETYEPTDAPVVPAEETDDAALMERMIPVALSRRPDFEQAQRAVRTARIQRIKADSDALPRLDATARASALGIDDTFNGGFSRIFRMDSFEALGGIALELPLENRAARNAAARAELEERRAQAAVRDLESRIILDVREASRSIRLQERTLKAANEEVRLADERYAAESVRYENGMTTTNLVLAAFNDQNAARLNQLRARIDIALSRMNLKRVTSGLLEDYQIDVMRQLAPR